MAAANEQDLVRVLDATGLSSISSQVIATLKNGNVTETTFPVGGTLDWMALRRRGQPDILRAVRWGGAKPFPAFTFTVKTATHVYTFVLPKACANLSLQSAVA